MVQNKDTWLAIVCSIASDNGLLETETLVRPEVYVYLAADMLIAIKG